MAQIPIQVSKPEAMNIVTIPSPSLSHLVTHQTLLILLWVSFLNLFPPLFLFPIPIVIPQCRVFHFLNEIIEDDVLVSILVLSNSFSILLPVIFLTENIIMPFPSLKFFKRFPLPSKTSKFSGIACLILKLLTSDDFTLSSNNNNILHIWIWMWWRGMGFYWSISEFCQECLKIIVFICLQENLPLKQRGKVHKTFISYGHWVSEIIEIVFQEQEMKHSTMTANLPISWNLILWAWFYK